MLGQSICLDSLIPNKMTSKTIANGTINIVSVKITDPEILITNKNITVDLNGLIDQTVFTIAFGSPNKTVNYQRKTQDCLLDGEIVSDTLSVNIMGSVNVSHLNVSIIFPLKHSDNDTNSNNYECMFYDIFNDIWSDVGCHSEYNILHNQVICKCNHLTTFIIIRTLYSNDQCNIEKSVLNDTEWKTLHLIFTILYGLLTIYILYSLFPFIYYKALHSRIKHTAIQSVFVILLISIIEFGVSLQFYLYESYLSEYLKYILSLALFLRHILLFVEFTILFYSFYIIAESMNPNILTVQACMKTKLIIVNMVNILICIGIISILIITNSYPVFIILIIQISLMSYIVLLSIIFVVYSYKMSTVLIETAKHMAEINEDPTRTDDKKIANKFRIINCILTSYFILKLTELILSFLIMDSDNNKITIILRIFSITTNYLILVLILYLYRESILRMIENELGERILSKILSLRTLSSRSTQTIVTIKTSKSNEYDNRSSFDTNDIELENM